MVVAGWICSLAALLSLTLTLTHSHRGEVDTYHVSAGRLFLLRCHIAAAHTIVTWSRGGSRNRSLPAGVEVRDGLLWFLPLQTSHNGTYICENRRDGTSLTMELGVSVSSGECPEPAETKTIVQGMSSGLPCQQIEIFRLMKPQSIRWLKDCQPLERQGEPISINDDGFMRLPLASEQDAGKYTCLVDVSLDGKTYTSAHSIQLKINDGMYCSLPPEVVYPQQEVIAVKVGARVELKCLAYAGVIEDNDILMYWTVNESYTEDHEELKESWKYTKAKGRVYCGSTLSISKVLHQFLNVPIRCHVMNSVGGNDGLVWLQEADHSALHTSVALCLTASLILFGLAAAFLFCKIDLVLAYRELMRHISKQQAPDGKLYDAYVSFLYSDTLSSAESFALKILPEELEKQHGYSLYIRGRDDCPGEGNEWRTEEPLKEEVTAMHDITASTVQRCRRLILILSADAKSSTDGKTEEERLVLSDRNQLCYEQKVGLYDALTQNEPQVILIEIGKDRLRLKKMHFNN
ncbi:hypothetical protein PAMA_002873 [Pampus argenteus]